MVNLGDLGKFAKRSLDKIGRVYADTTTLIADVGTTISDIGGVQDVVDDVISYVEDIDYWDYLDDIFDEVEAGFLQVVDFYDMLVSRTVGWTSFLTDAIEGVGSLFSNEYLNNIFDWFNTVLQNDTLTVTNFSKLKAVGDVATQQSFRFMLNKLGVDPE